MRRDHWLARRAPIYYGWVILPISIISAVLTSPGQTFMISVFNPSLREALDLTLTELAGAYMAGTALASLPLSAVGTWSDRLGIRKMLFLAGSLFSLACVFMSQVKSLPMLFFAFLFLRLLAPGALELLSANMLPMWFRDKLGTISGVKSVAVNLLIGGVPVGALALIQRYGWRTTYLLAAAFVFSLLLPMVYFLFVNRPEEIGQTIDGGARLAAPDLGTSDQSPERAYTLKMAVRTRSYWILTLTWLAWAAIGTAIAFNFLPIFTAKGLSEQQAAAIFTGLMTVSAVFQILGGILADRVPLRWLAFGGPALYAIAVGALILVSGSSAALVYILVLGLGQGLFMGLGATVWVHYFGRAHLGKIRGTSWTFAVAGSSIGPFLMGVSYDQTGDFRLSLVSIVVILTGLAIAGLWATPPAGVERVRST
jgi:MFS family permease